MERIKRMVWIHWAALVFGAPWSFADVVFTPPRQPVNPTPVAYPESKFGSSPTKPSQIPTSRRPAGMMFADQRPGEKVEGIPNTQKTPTYDMHPTQMDSSTKMTSQFGSTGSVGDLIPDRKRGIQEIALIAGDLGYFPKTVFVTKNIPVRMFVTGASSKPLCIMMDSFDVQRQIQTKNIEEITFTPKLPGKHRFYCPINGMEGVLVVKEMSTVLK